MRKLSRVRTFLYLFSMCINKRQLIELNIYWTAKGSLVKCERRETKWPKCRDPVVYDWMRHKYIHYIIHSYLDRRLCQLQNVDLFHSNGVMRTPKREPLKYKCALLEWKRKQWHIETVLCYHTRVFRMRWLLYLLAMHLGNPDWVALHVYLISFCVCCVCCQHIIENMRWADLSNHQKALVDAYSYI